MNRSLSKTLGLAASMLGLLAVACSGAPDAEADVEVEGSVASAASVALRHPMATESICGGTSDFQDVERYDGTQGVSQAFVRGHERPVGQIQWKSDLASRYSNPGNVNGARWCSGTLVSGNMFVTAGHCFDVDINGWTTPRAGTTPITPAQIAREMVVNFNYQTDAAGTTRPGETFQVSELVEYRKGGLDYAVLRLVGTPAARFGFAKVAASDARANERIAIIGHPAGRPKQISAGTVQGVSSTSITYSNVDTLGGNSGSGILSNVTNRLVGVHTNGGCTSSGGANSGQPIGALLRHSQTLREMAQRLVVFARGSDNAIWHKFYDGGWSDWISLGGVSTSAPATVLTAEGRLVVFMRGTDGAIWHKYYENGWSAWTSLGGNMASAPTATVTAQGRLVVFARGTDGAVWHKFYDGGWSPWTSLGGSTTDDPTATVNADGRLVVFARGTNGALWHTYYDAGWVPWTSIGGSIASSPAATLTAEGRLVVFARGTDNAIWHTYYDAGWAAWTSLGGNLVGAPAATVDAGGQLVVFARSTDNAIWHKWYNAGWSGWASLGGGMTSAPAAL